jgi:hypothetical protein
MGLSMNEWLEIIIRHSRFPEPLGYLLEPGEEKGHRAQVGIMAFLCFFFNIS